MYKEHIDFFSGLEDYGNVASRPIPVPDGAMPGSTVCTSIDLTDDSSVEPAETFTLSLVVNPFEPLTVTASTASITIIDNDSEIYVTCACPCRVTVPMGYCLHNSIISIFLTVAVVNVSSPLSVVEGNTGITNFNIEVELQISSVLLARDVIVTLSTEEDTATGRLDQSGRRNGEYQ